MPVPYRIAVLTRNISTVSGSAGRHRSTSELAKEWKGLIAAVSSNLEPKDTLDTKEHGDLAANGGTLTPAEKARINKQQKIRCRSRSTTRNTMAANRISFSS